MHVSDICKQFELFGKGIGNETRFKILIALFSGEQTVSQLVATLKLPQPSISQHLKVLKTGGLVLGVKNGQEIHYHIDKENVVRLLTQMLEGVSRGKLDQKEAKAYLKAWS